MRSAISYFKTLVRSDLRHYWPICFLYTFIWALILPMTILRDLPDASSASMYSEAGQMLLWGAEFAIFMAAAFGVAMAMVCYSYLMNSCSVGLLHSLPVGRSTQFFAHFASGMSMLLAGNVITLLLTVLAQVSVMGKVVWQATLLWFTLSTLLDFVFFAIAILCTMFTGWLLAVPVLYVGLNFAAAAVYLLFESLCDIFYFGYNFKDNLPSAINWLTPVAKLGDTFENAHIDTYDGIDWVGTTLSIERLKDGFFRAVIIYTVVALVLLGVSYLLYRLRHSEAAGDSVAFSWAKPIFRYVIALVGGLGAGIGVYYLIFGDGYNASYGGLLVCQIVMTVLCYIAAEMLIRKSVQVLKRGWKGLVAACAVMIVLYVGLSMDVFGIESYVPEASQVESVSVYLNCNGDRSSLPYTDEETILAAIDAQKAAIAQGKDDDNYEGTPCYMSLVYTLKNGRTVSRDYLWWNLEKDSELHKALNALGNTKTIHRTMLYNTIANEFSVCDNIDGYVTSDCIDYFTSYSVEDIESMEEKINSAYVSRYDGKDGEDEKYCNLSAEQAHKLYRAIAEDVDTGIPQWDAMTDTLYGKDAAMDNYYIEFIGKNREVIYEVKNFPDTFTNTLKVLQSLHFEKVQDVVE